MPDLVNDPRYEGIHTTSEENPLHDDDPSNDWRFESWKRERDLWREWHAKQEDAVAKLVQQGAESGDDADTTLRKAGFENRKEHGMAMFSRFGNNGFYATQGAAADPGWTYDWARGMKYNHGTADKYANGTLGTRWVPINETERAERNKAVQYQKAGLTDYGRQANAEAFNRTKGGHFNRDARTGLWYSGSGVDDPNNIWVNQYGQRASAPRPQMGGGMPQQGPAGGPGGWLPQHDGFGQFMPQEQMAQYGGAGMMGGGMNGGMMGGVPNMYAGTMQATGFGAPPPQQNIFGARAQQQQAQQIDETSPYQQLTRKPSPTGAPKNTGVAGGRTGALGAF